MAKSLGDIKRVVLTGASGWIGRACIERLISEFGYKKHEILAFGSKERTIFINSEIGYLKVFSFSDINKLKNFEIEIFLPLAFITKDQIQKNGVEEYVKNNLEIINLHKLFIKRNKMESVLYFSSGAVFEIDKSNFQKLDFQTNPYAKLKIFEEHMLLDLFSNQDFNLSIVRLWNCSGYGLRKIETFAISNLINQARFSDMIYIKSDRPLWRRYVDSREVASVGINTCLNERLKIFDSGGPIIEIGNLAREILVYFGRNTQIIRPKGWELIEAEYYLSKETDYEEQLRKYYTDKVPMGISEQIHNTVEAIKILEKGLE